MKVLLFLFSFFCIFDVYCHEFEFRLYDGWLNDDIEIVNTSYEQWVDVKITVEHISGVSGKFARSREYRYENLFPWQSVLLESVFPSSESTRSHQVLIKIESKKGCTINSFINDIDHYFGRDFNWVPIKKKSLQYVIEK